MHKIYKTGTSLLHLGLFKPAGHNNFCIGIVKVFYEILVGGRRTEDSFNRRICFGDMPLTLVSLFTIRLNHKDLGLLNYSLAVI